MCPPQTTIPTMCPPQTTTDNEYPTSPTFPFNFSNKLSQYKPPVQGNLFPYFETDAASNNLLKVVLPSVPTSIKSSKFLYTRNFEYSKEGCLKKC